jgi:hypothetical protein
MSVHVFAGPTLPHADIGRRLGGATIHAPVRHGDLLRLPLAIGDVVLIIDGVFHHELPVRHKEILDAIARGAAVLGASSMGALRAAELHIYGMVGVGSIFEMYRDGTIDADDEVAVTHGPEPDWRLHSEALVNIRHAVRLAADTSAIPAAHAERIVGLAGRLPYPQRIWPLIQREATGPDADLRASIAAVRAWLDVNPDAGNLKRLDALRAIDVVADGSLTREPGAALGWAGETGWRTIDLAQWSDSVSPPANSAIPARALLHYQQIYSEKFPELWERYVLGRIAQSAAEPSPEHRSPAERALAVATDPRLGLELLGERQRAAWLTPDELASLDEAELTIRVLVRSANRYSNIDAAAFVAECADSAEAEPAVVEAQAINRAAADASPERHIDHLSTGALAAHLAAVWHLPPGADARYLAAAARDRGFVSAGEAIGAVRPFFLSHTGHRS